MTVELKTGLLGALGVHALLLVSLPSFFMPNQFRVVAAPSSLEVALVSVRTLPEVRITETPPVTSPVTEKKISDRQAEKPVEDAERTPEKTEKKEVNSFSNARAGALSEAQPLETHNRPPAYPRIARERGYEGRLLVKVFITKQGFVEKAEIARSSGYQVLDRSAVKAAEQWRFEPARRFDAPVNSILEIPFVFRLDE